jgi:hypothetical protein
MTVKNSKKTKNLNLEYINNNPSRQAGSNYLSIQVPSSDWKIPDQLVKISIRDAKTLRSFLNENLGE